MEGERRGNGCSSLGGPPAVLPGGGCAGGERPLLTRAWPRPTTGLSARPPAMQPERPPACSGGRARTPHQTHTLTSGPCLNSSASASDKYVPSPAPVPPATDWSSRKPSSQSQASSWGVVGRGACGGAGSGREFISWVPAMCWRTSRARGARGAQVRVYQLPLVPHAAVWPRAAASPRAAHYHWQARRAAGCLRCGCEAAHPTTYLSAHEVERVGADAGAKAVVALRPVVAAAAVARERAAARVAPGRRRCARGCDGRVDDLGERGNGGMLCVSVCCGLGALDPCGSGCDSWFLKARDPPTPTCTVLYAWFCARNGSHHLPWAPCQ